jgi:hypothetical protein
MIPLQQLSRRFSLAVGFSLASKIASFVVQLLAVPFAISYCGVDTYVLYVQLVALSLGPCVLILRLGPRFVGVVSILYTEKNYSDLSDVIRRGFQVTAFSAIIAAGFMLILPFSPWSIVAFESRDVFIGFSIIGLSYILNAFLNYFESIQTGFQETYLVAFSYTLSSITCCVLLFVLLPICSNLVTFVLILHVVPAFSRSLQVFTFAIRNQDLLHRQSQEKGISPPVLSDAFGYTMMTGACMYVGFQAPMLMLIANSSESAVRQFITLAFQFILQALGVMGIVFVPMVPVLANAWKSHDHIILKRYRRIVFCLVIIAGVFSTVCSSVAAIHFGNEAFLSAYRLILAISTVGGFFCVIAWEQFLAVYLLATSVHSKSSVVYKLSLVRSVVSFLCVSIAIYFGANLYAMFFMSIAYALCSCLPMQVMIEKNSFSVKMPALVGLKNTDTTG